RVGSRVRGHHRDLATRLHDDAGPLRGSACSLRSPGPVVGAETGAGAARAFRAGVLTNMTNPKAAVFSLSFLPQFVPNGFPAFPTQVGLAVIWAAVDTVWFGAVIWLVGSNALTLGRPAARRALTICSGLVLIGLGVNAVFGEVR